MRVVITLVLFLSLLSFAQETDAAVESRQKAVLLALDSIEENVMGFALNGRAKGGMLSSTLNSDALPNAESAAEHLMFTDFLLGISVRPSNETKASFDLRFHKDWQSAYREGNNSPVIRWWSYDGNILGKRLKFNLGTMRLAYTPLTIYLPEPQLIMEPEIFYNLKKEAMEDRYLDGTNRRLLQGLNAEYRISAGVFDNVLLQGTLLRLKRNQTKKISYDFDPSNDRYSATGRLGFEISGFSIGVNDVYTFDRFSSTIKVGDSLSNEKNNVLSFEVGYDGKNLLQGGPLNFGVGAEYALSNWKHSVYEKVKVVDTEIRLEGIDSLIPSNTLPGNNPTEFYPHYVEYTTTRTEYKLSREERQYKKGALIANAFVAFNQNPIEVKLLGHFLNTDKDFEAELAMSPAYLPNLPILNSHADLTSSAFEQFRSGSLESMYYSLYYSLPMNALTVVSGTQGVPDEVMGSEMYKSKNLTNNYKFSQYYNNAYTQQTYSRTERDSILHRLDPAVNLALPFGYATPDRSGGDADLNFVWNKAVSIKGVFGKYSSSAGDYTRLGGGLELNIANLAGLSQALVLSGSYEQNKEENGLFNPTVNRIMAGAKIGIWRGLSLIGGFQQLDKEFENAYMSIIDQTNERLVIGGPQVKISEGANLSLLGGMLSNSIKGGGEELNMDKYIVSGVVTVEF